MQIINLEQIEKLDCSIPDLAQALRTAFLATVDGGIAWKPKSMVGAADGTFLMSTFCSWAAQNLNVFHSLTGATYQAQEQGAPAYQSLQLLSAYDNAQPLALIDGTYTSKMLPAGITHLMTPHLAISRTRIATFVGAGTQARVNLRALDGILPIDEVRIISRTQKSAESFADFVRERGQKAVIMQAGPAAMEGADIVVSTISASQGLTPFLDPAWVTPGTFVNAVDLGRSWKTGFSAFDYSVIDDRGQAEIQAKEGRLPHTGPFHSEIADVLSGKATDRTQDNQRSVLIHPGNVVGVMGITALLYSRLSSTT